MPRRDPDGANSPQGTIQQGGNVENSAGASYGSPSRTSGGSPQPEDSEVFRKEIIPSFVDLTEFCKFARSCYGLMLDEHVITEVVDDNQDGSSSTMLSLLMIWKQNKENDLATIKDVVEQYHASRGNIRKGSSEWSAKGGVKAAVAPNLGEERLEDIFQDEIIPSFSSPEEFRKFAMASSGLGLSYEHVTAVQANYRKDSFKQMMLLLNKWREKTKDPSVEKIRAVRKRYR